MKKDLSFLVEYARVHVPCMKVNAAVVLVVRIVESHQALSFRWVSPRQRTRDPGRTREGACMRINGLQRQGPLRETGRRSMRCLAECSSLREGSGAGPCDSPRR
jgi:hypothetical protein